MGQDNIQEQVAQHGGRIAALERAMTDLTDTVDRIASNQDKTLNAVSNLAASVQAASASAKASDGRIKTSTLIGALGVIVAITTALGTYFVTPLQVRQDALIKSNDETHAQFHEATAETRRHELYDVERWARLDERMKALEAKAK